MARRLRALREALEEGRSDGALVTDMANIRYLTGFTGSSAYLLVTGKAAYFLTDSRYTLQASSEVSGPWRVRIYRQGLFKTLAPLVAKDKVKTLGFEGAVVAFDMVGSLRKALKGVRLKSLRGVVGRGRQVKDLCEIGRIRRAIEVSEKGFSAARRVLKALGTEREAALAIEGSVKKAGADSLSFDSIVLAGRRTALPHGKPSAKRIRPGELVVVDMGVFVDGYASDETRTYSVGRATKRQREIYSVVKEAHDRAIDKVKPGVVASEVDRAARDCIKKAGYGKYFGHGTGHGVGLEVHEGPVIGPGGPRGAGGPLRPGDPGSDTVLAEGMVFTVEPGIYIPGFGGVRIEDMVLVTGAGCEVLTRRAAKEFKIIA
jgi:Xaa-Pro aminopeptidase